MSDEKLHPCRCPEKGASLQKHYPPPPVEDTPVYSVHCPDCCASVSSLDEAEARRMWNAAMAPEPAVVLVDPSWESFEVLISGLRKHGPVLLKLRGAK